MLVYHGEKTFCQKNMLWKQQFRKQIVRHNNLCGAEVKNIHPVQLYLGTLQLLNLHILRNNYLK